MKTLQIVLLFLTSFNYISAQISSDNKTKGSRIVRLGNVQTVDRSFMECVYEHCIYDPFFEKTEIYDEILEVGRKASRYGNYNTFVLDSIIKADYPNGITRDEWNRQNEKIGDGSTTETLKDLADSRLKHYESIFFESYVYDEELPAFDWQFTDETGEVCGYKCIKATTEFRGRTWNAWYAEEIPISNGPLKFGGLPGLILKVEDSKKEHIFEAMQIRKSDRDFGYMVRSLLIPTDRKTFNKMLRDFRTDVVGFLGGELPAAVKPDGTTAVPRRRLFFNPVELD